MVSDNKKKRIKNSINDNSEREIINSEKPSDIEIFEVSNPDIPKKRKKNQGG